MTHNVVIHPAFPPPENENVLVWRYLDFQKFDWLVRESRLFMPNAAHLGDPLEGTQPPGHDEWWASLAANATSDVERDAIEYNHQRLARFAAAFRTRYYVSCWHINPGENPAMWTRYTRSSKAVAVQTTYAKLRQQLRPFVEIGKVRYIDYSVDRLPTLNMFEYITHKDKFFEYEQELRAVAMHPVPEGPDRDHFRANFFESEQASSFRVYAPSLNLPSVLESVVLHPSADQDFTEQIRDLCTFGKLPQPSQSRMLLP
jgi:hypothetical protein